MVVLLAACLPWLVIGAFLLVCRDACHCRFAELSEPAPGRRCSCSQGD
jgi:hypothetical protein